MSQFERVYKIDRLLRGRIPPTKQRILDALEVSEPTFKRDIEYMRSRLGAPVVWDRQTGGYRYSSQEEFTVPGLWFSADEIHSLLLFLHIIDQLQPSFLQDQVRPFRERLSAMACAESDNFDSISTRIRLIASPARISSPVLLDVVVRATLGRRRLRLTYRTRSRQSDTERDVSPGRLVYYRGNWYLDAWCHQANAVRRFAVDAMASATLLPEAAQDLPPEPDCTGYGIFSGVPDNLAVLRFNPKSADWVRASQWHPDQQLEELPGGAVLLRVPYSQDQEILMDILRHGADVEVLAPEALRQHVAETLRSAAEQYWLTKRTASRAHSLPARQRAEAG